MISPRARRTVLLFLILLTIVVLVRIAASAEGADSAGESNHSPAPGHDRLAQLPSPILRLLEPGGLVAAGSTLRRTVSLIGIRSDSRSIELGWEARLNGALAASGREPLNDRAARIALAIPLPLIDRPAGLDLDLQVLEAGVVTGATTFPFLVYPKKTAETIADLFGRARVALYDPEGRAGPLLASLGIHAETIPGFEALALYKGDLIVVGPGGFSRGREALGPILEARVSTGTNLLLLEQPTLPGTFSEELRLWPSFSIGGEHGSLDARQHPVLTGLEAKASWSARTSGAPPVRPLLPPTRGNFRVISEIRVKVGPAWQEGVTLLEMPIGTGTALVAQASLCEDFTRQPGARLVLANALTYLLQGSHGLKRAFLYGNTLDDLPACVARLAPSSPRVPASFSGVDILLLAGDWRAPRVAAAAGVPPLAEVARFLHEGGTILLLNPQPLSISYLERVTGVSVSFEKTDAGEEDSGTGSALLEGIAREDLAVLGNNGGASFRLRSLPGQDNVLPLLIAPGIAEYRVGRGTLASLSLPDAGACSAPRASSLLARLLTNLGIPLDHGPGLDPESVSRLDD